MILQDKVVIVSGIGPGLGIELALQAANEGASIAIAARTESKLDEAEAAVNALGLGTKVLKVPTDISSSEQCQQLVDKTLETFGRIDVLINSAYNPGAFEPVEKANLDSWRQAMEVNLYGTVGLTQAVVPQMKKQGGGAVVMVNTMVTRKPMATQAGYAASKAALQAATAHLAVELGQYQIRVNSTFMGWMWGPPVEGYFDMMASHTGADKQALIAEVEKNIPLGKIPDDAECAKAVMMLASDYASVVTGACLDVNGGEYMAH